MRIVGESTCDCGCEDACEPAADGDAVVVKVMGTGCKNCRQLHENTLEAAGRISKAIQVEYVTDIAEISGGGRHIHPCASHRREGHLCRQSAFNREDRGAAAMTEGRALSAKGTTATTPSRNRKIGKF